MTREGSNFLHLRVKTIEGSVDSIADENGNPPTSLTAAEISEVQKNGKLIARIYQHKFNPTCTVVIRSDGTAVRICK